MQLKCPVCGTTNSIPMSPRKTKCSDCGQYLTFEKGKIKIVS